jgi:4-oxalocrotonate tautomerase
MPLVRIDLPAGRPADYHSAIGQVVYAAMTKALNVPKDDRFQVIAEHSHADLILDPTYLGIHRSTDAILIQVTLNDGRSVEQKKAFYKAVADGLLERVALRREDVIISLVEVRKENWSFGNGEAQYA